MMNRYKAIIFVLSISFVFSCEPSSLSSTTSVEFDIESIDLYSKDISYTYAVTRTEKGTIFKDTIYLLSYPSKPWRLDSTQHKIVWIFDKKALSQKTLGTGMIVNKNWIWLHPPRENSTYSILEFCPFPQVKLPIEENKTWNWELEVGGNWSDIRWGRIGEELVVNSQYQIKEARTVIFKAHQLQCNVIDAVSNSSLGKGKLKSYFHEGLGFVKMDFETIKGEQIVLELIDIQYLELNSTLFIS